MVALEAIADYLSGFLSGAISCTVCAPLDLTRTRLNLTRTTTTQVKGFWNTMKFIYKSNGFIGYYDGNLTISNISKKFFITARLFRNSIERPYFPASLFRDLLQGQRKYPYKNKIF